MDYFFSKFEKHSPAQESAVIKCEQSLGVKLPLDYVALLRLFNGGEGFIGDGSYLMLWRVEELVPFNREYFVNEYCPGIILFGSSGGGEAFAFDSSWKIVTVPFVGMSNELVKPLSNSFVGFLEVLSLEGD